MKLAVLLSRLSNGGLERVQSTLVSGLHARGATVMLAAGQIQHRFPGDFPDATPVLEIAGKGPSSFPVGLYRFLRDRQPDCLFTTSNDAACIALAMKRLFFPKLRVIVTQHLSLSGPIGHAKGMKKLKLYLEGKLMGLTLPWADQIVAVTQQVACDLSRVTGIAVENIRVIHNPIIGDNFATLEAAPAPATPWQDDRGPIVIFMGRFSVEKRLDLLLDAFTRLHPRHRARLLLLGDGPLRGEVEARIARERIEDRCAIAGYVDNVFPLLRTAQLLVLPSDYEGFGNVLVEAMACGVQVVATDCPHGPSEILASGRYGQLVPTGNADALHDAMERSLTGGFHVPAHLLRMRSAEFGVSKAIDAYWDVAAMACPKG